jgi:hypothetical protein
MKISRARPARKYGKKIENGGEEGEKVEVEVGITPLERVYIAK